MSASSAPCSKDADQQRTANDNAEIDLERVLSSLRPHNGVPWEFGPGHLKIQYRRADGYREMAQSTKVTACLAERGTPSVPGESAFQDT